MSNFKKSLRSLSLIVLAIALAIGINIALAVWTGPTDNPPAGNVSEPLNVSSNTQTLQGSKTINGNQITDILTLGLGTAINGIMGVNGIAQFFSTPISAIFDGKVGIGTANPQAKLDVAGGVKVGSDNSVCDLTKEGTIRYNDATSCMEYCGGMNLGWLTMGSCGSYSKTVTGYDYILAGNSETLMQGMQISDNFPASVMVDFTAKVYIVACDGCTNNGVIKLYVDGVVKKEMGISINCPSVDGTHHCTQWHDVSLDYTIPSGGGHTVEIRWRRTGGSEPNPQLHQPGNNYPRILKVSGL